MSTWLRGVLAISIAVPCVNYLATYEMLARIGIESGTFVWGVITGSNGLGPLIALAVCIGMALRHKASFEPEHALLPAATGMSAATQTWSDCTRRLVSGLASR